MKHFHSAILALISLALVIPAGRVFALERVIGIPAHKAPGLNAKPKTTVPAIARILGVRIGWNGQHRLERRFGQGVRSIGGHSNGVESWRTRLPAGVIVTDGFNYNDEGELLETLEWTLTKADRSIPLVRRLPQRAGWLGTISLGMTERQVTRLLQGTHLPKPDKSGGTWIWVQKGHVELRDEVYRTWTAALGFEQGRLTSITVRCD